MWCGCGQLALPGRLRFQDAIRQLLRRVPAQFNASQCSHVSVHSHCCAIAGPQLCAPEPFRPPPLHELARCGLRRAERGSQGGAARAGGAGQRSPACAHHAAGAAAHAPDGGGPARRRRVIPVRPNLPGLRSRRDAQPRRSACDAGLLANMKRLRSLVGSIFIPPRLVLTAPVLSQRWRARRGSRCGRCCRRRPRAPTPGRGASAARGTATTTARTTPCWRTPTEPRHERKPRRCIKSNTCVTFRRFLVSLAHSCCSSRLRTSLLRNVAQRGALRRLLRRLGRLCELRRHAR